jgi:hypothetical protein
MPSRCAKTGTRASDWTRATRLFPPSRHDHVNRTIETLQHFADSGAVGHRHDLDRIGRQVCRFKPFDQRLVNGRRRMRRIRAAAQDDGIARLEAERTGIGRHIGAAFINDTDHAKRVRTRSI